MASKGEVSVSLYDKYAISSTWKVTLDKETVEGVVYCTDSISNVLALKGKGGIRMISVNAIKESKMLQGPTEDEAKPPTNPVHAKKALDEREKRAIKLAQESLRNLNPKASPKGQAVFDRLVKACNDVVWKGESIIVLNQIQVDAPYSTGDCKMISGPPGGSFDRVQKIVDAAGP